MDRGKYAAAVQLLADPFNKQNIARGLDLWQELACEEPDNAKVLYSLGTALAMLEQDGVAIPVLARAAELDPKEVGIWSQLGSVLRRQQLNDWARDCYEIGLELNPNDRDSLTGLAGTYVNFNNPDMGIKYSEMALKVEPNWPHAINSLALCLLEKGDWKRGWGVYRKRENVPGYDTRNFYDGKPRWDGKSHVGKLAIHAEQGIGDELLFASCINELKPFADKIVGEVAARLLLCFRRTWPEIEWYGTHDELMYYEGESLDAWYRMGDLPSLWRPTPKACPGTPYMKPYAAGVEGYRERLKGLGDGPYVGFAWRGGTKGTHERVRNASMKYWSDLVKASPDITPVSVQYGQWGEDQALDLPHWPAINDNVDELMALIAACDLVITCNQTAVHMAGSMGIPCWTATPKKAAWRYCHEVDGHMCWYNSVKIYRGEWDDVFKRLSGDIRKLSEIEKQAA